MCFDVSAVELQSHVREDGFLEELCEIERRLLGNGVRGARGWSEALHVDVREGEISIVLRKSEEEWGARLGRYTSGGSLHGCMNARPRDAKDAKGSHRPNLAQTSRGAQANAKVPFHVES